MEGQWKKKKNDVCYHFHPCRKFHQTSVPPAHALKLVSGSPSYFSSCCLCTGTWREWVSAQALQEQSLSFPQPAIPPGCKPCWFSKPDIKGTCLPSAGSPGWGAQGGAWTPYSSAENSMVVISPTFVGCCTRVWDLTRLCVYPSHPSHYGLFSVSLVVENMFCWSSSYSPR